jgi:hypothetical protein
VQCNRRMEDAELEVLEDEFEDDRENEHPAYRLPGAQHHFPPMPPAGGQSQKEERSSLPLVPPEVSDGEEQR